jgi:2-polyprenyl-3-methyl-5-hydroxy-6-metoxy-1,4-benzoquinol methylase
MPEAKQLSRFTRRRVCPMRRSRRYALVAFTAVLLAPQAVLQAAGAPQPVGATKLAEQILTTSGVDGGVIIQLGCGDGQLTAALRASDRFLVQGLDADAKNVEAA